MWTVTPQLRSRALFLIPVIASVAVGVTWIALNAGGARGPAHTVWQSLVVTETAVALLLRRNKPVGALAGTVAAYVLFQLYVITLLPIAASLYTVTRLRGRRVAIPAAVVTVVVVALTPLLYGGR
jgi:hypothetical protein